jgi:hypothetical protein
LRPRLALLGLLAMGMIGCGSAAEPPTASDPSQLDFGMTVNPAPPRGVGLSSASTVSVIVWDTTGSRLTSATLTLLDAQGAVLAREALQEPIGFEPSGTVQFRRTVSWAAAGVLARQINVQFTVTRADGTSRSVDRTVDF